MKKAHIISHTHWDREWYLSYETHHMLLVEFMDTLIQTLETDSEYKSFHLDGQTIILDDYLQVRPEMKERLTKLIQDGRILVGPWYVLQDEFLTSSEANVRNLQVGHEMAKEYGKVCKVGYFPDSFGNMGQAPQILQQAGIDTAVFGRGVKPTGFNNQVGEGSEFESQYSEMYWQSPDGSKVLGILFANWYSNGNEVPTALEEIQGYWDKRLGDAKKYASTNHLLFMNGCDHQPVQTDLSSAIKISNESYDEVEFIHSNFNDYIKEVKAELRPDLKVIEGELRSQQTDGWYTLANTASARVYLKQMNVECQTLFEKVAEPLATIAYNEGFPYPHHLFTYGWKTLMQNHPHDSICGCSVDSVHEEMVSRFKKAKAVAEHIIKSAKEYLASRINTDTFKAINQDAIPFYITNTTGWERNGVATVVVDGPKKYFREDSLENVVEYIKTMKLPAYKVVDETGKEIPATVTEVPYAFDYDLPRDAFRQPFMVRRLKVTLEAIAIPSLGWKSYALVPNCDEVVQKDSLFVKENTVENKWYQATIKENGSLTVYDKNTNKSYNDLVIYEDHGDIGNEYIYRMPEGEVAITTKDSVATISIVEDTDYRAVVSVKHCIHIPKSATKVLDQEIADIIEFKHRKATRVKETIPMEITTEYVFERASKVIKVKTSFKNEAIDHRLRALFETGLNAKHHYVDSIFEVAKRSNTTAECWENPCNAAHQQVFVNIHDETSGITIANKGLAEYEVLENNIIALTLHRGVRELGDWGIFMTPEAQCLGNQEVEFAIIIQGEEDCYDSYKEAYQYVVPYCSTTIEKTTGSLKATHSLLTSEGRGVMWSSLKVNKITGDIIGRWYNVSDESNILDLSTDRKLYLTDLLEEDLIEEISNKIELKKGKILTVGFKR